RRSHSSFVPRLKDKDGSRIFLTPAFGKQIEAKVCSVTIYFKNCDNNLYTIVVAVTDQMNVPCLVTPEIRQLLTKPKEGGSGGAFKERKVLTVYFETEEECIEKKTPPGRQAP
ncbi:RNase H domain-containing protein, partial [Trichonephila clavata]